MAGLAFYFIRKRSARKPYHGEPAEIGPSAPDYSEVSPEKYAYHSELPGPVAAFELPSREPVELHGETVPAAERKYGF